MKPTTARFWMALFAMTALLWAGLGGQALAAPPSDSTQTVSVTASVGTTFTLTCDKSAVTLTGNPSDTKSDTVICTAKSNYTPSPWLLKIKTNQALTDSSISESIPLANFLHSSTGGSGTRDDSSDTAFTTSDVTYYTAHASEKNNLPGGTAITSTLKVNIPNNQATGSYSATVTFTMTVTP